MSIIGNPLIVGSGNGGASAEVFAIQTGIVNNTSVSNLQSLTIMSEENYFTINNSDFVCQKAETYVVAYGVKGCYNAGGNLINGTAYIYLNGSSVSSKGSNSTAWAVNSLQLSLSVGDTITVKGKNSSGTNAEPIYLCIYAA